MRRIEDDFAKPSEKSCSDERTFGLSRIVQSHSDFSASTDSTRQLVGSLAL